MKSYKINLYNLSGLVIDGSISYQFNEGSNAMFEVRPEDSLLTISMD